MRERNRLKFIYKMKFENRFEFKWGYKIYFLNIILIKNINLYFNFFYLFKYLKFLYFWIVLGEI